MSDDATLVAWLLGVLFVAALARVAWDELLLTWEARRPLPARYAPPPEPAALPAPTLPPLKDGAFVVDGEAWTRPDVEPVDLDQLNVRGGAR